MRTLHTVAMKYRAGHNSVVKSNIDKNQTRSELLNNLFDQHGENKQKL